MANLILPPIDVLATAAAELVELAADNRPRQNAINKAILMLHRGAQPTLTAGGILVESRTRNLVHRVSTLHGCNCEAGQAQRPCWHAALVEIVEQAQIRTVPTFVRERADWTAQARHLLDECQADRAALVARQRLAQEALDELYV